MKNGGRFALKIVLLLLIILTWRYLLHVAFSRAANVYLIVGGVLMAYPVVGIGRWWLDRHHSENQTHLITTFVHFGLGFAFGIPLIKGFTVAGDLPWGQLPVPFVVGKGLVWISGVACFLTVANLAIKGFGAPFFIKLSSRLASDWLYARSRNPMVVATLMLFISLSLAQQSLFMLLWTLFLFTPTLLFFIKWYEEQELAYRFGASYLAYKARTPFLFPIGKRTRRSKLK
ncbi:MAG: hypothetical protein LWW85_15025 [Marinilabiliales bacterium]|nr:hypothetical protein [Marinilabiliales bacterium]